MVYLSAYGAIFFGPLGLLGIAEIIYLGRDKIKEKFK